MVDQIVTLNYTGTIQVLTIPAGIGPLVTAYVWGGAGGLGGGTAGGNGSAGDCVKLTFAVREGDRLAIGVGGGGKSAANGGAGGYGAAVYSGATVLHAFSGGNGGAGAQCGAFGSPIPGGGGGGATTIFLGQTLLASAAGGGGGGGAATAYAASNAVSGYVGTGGGDPTLGEAGINGQTGLGTTTVGFYGGGGGGGGGAIGSDGGGLGGTALTDGGCAGSSGRSYFSPNTDLVPTAQIIGRNTVLLPYAYNPSSTTPVSNPITELTNWGGLAPNAAAYPINTAGGSNGGNGYVLLLFSYISTPLVKKSGRWKPSDAYVKINGHWKTITNAYSKKDGKWRKLKAGTGQLTTISYAYPSDFAAGGLRPYTAISARALITTRTLTATRAATAFQPAAGVGGGLPYTYTATGLIAGLSIAVDTGIITGTVATATAATTATITVHDVQGYSATSTLVITVNPVLVTAKARDMALTRGIAAGTFATGPVTATGGTLPYVYSVSPALPTGLALNTANGQITGQTTVTGTASYTVTVTDTNGYASATAFSLAVNFAVTATADVPQKTVTVGTAFVSYTPVSGALGTAPYTFKLAATPVLATGLAYSAAGVLSGTATVAQAYSTYTAIVTDNLGSTASATFAVGAAAAVTATVVSKYKTVTLTKNAAVSLVGNFVPVVGAAGVAPLAYSITPALPAGLSFNTADGTVSGTPTTISAVTTYTVRVVDTNGSAASATFAITINDSLTVTKNNSYAAVTVSTGAPTVTPYAPVLATVARGTGPYTYSIAPALPNGLVFSSANGQISGTAIVTESTTTHTITARDVNLAAASDTFDLTVLQGVNAITVIAAKVLTQNAAIVPFTPVTATDGLIGAPFTYSAAPLPAGVTITPLGLTSGSFVGKPTGTLSTSAVTVTVVDTYGSRSTSTFNLTINAGVAAAATATGGVRVLTAGVPVDYRPVQATLGTVPYTYTVSVPALPAGFSFHSSNGNITGTGTIGNTTSYVRTVTATDVNGGVASATFTMSVNPALVGELVQPQANLTLSHAMVIADKSVNITLIKLTAGTGTAPYVYANLTALPAGLNMYTANSIIYGTPTAVTANAAYPISATDANGSSIVLNAGIAVNGVLIATTAIGSTELSQNTTITPFTPITASGGSVPYVYAVSPALPTGLSFSTTTGLITGKATASTPNAATTPYTVTITDAVKAVSTAQFNLRVSALTAKQLIATQTVTALTANVFLPVQGTGGVGTLAYTMTPLPAWAAISGSTGTVTVTSPTPTAPATTTTTTFTVTVADSQGGGSYSTFNLVTNIPITAVVKVSSTSVLQGISTSFVPVTASGGTGALTYRTNTALPTGLTIDPATGTISGKATQAKTLTTYSVTATDTVGATASAAFNLTVT